MGSLAYGVWPRIVDFRRHVIVLLFGGFQPTFPGNLFRMFPYHNNQRLHAHEHLSGQPFSISRPDPFGLVPLAWTAVIQNDAVFLLDRGGVFRMFSSHAYNPASRFRSIGEREESLDRSEHWRTSSGGWLRHGDQSSRRPGPSRCRCNRADLQWSQISCRAGKI